MKAALKIIFGASKSSQLWTPNQIPNAILWDASVASSLTSATGYSSWTDVYTGKVVSQATGSAQPTATSFNGFPALAFNGSQFLGGVDTGMPTSDLTIVSVSNLTANLAEGSYSTPLTYGASSNGSSMFALYARDSTSSLNNNCWAVSAYGNIAGINANYQNVPIVGTIVRSGSLYTVSANGQNTASGTLQTNGANVGTAGSLAIGSWNAALGYGGKHIGSIQKILVIPTALSGDLLDRCIGWAAWNSGLQSSLPNSNPYKNSPPTL